MNTSVYSKVFVVIMFQVVIVFIAEAQQWKNFTSTQNRRVIAIEEDTMWVSSEGGLFKYLIDGSRLSFYNHAEGLVDNNVYCAAIDNQGNKWIGAGIYTYYRSYSGGVSKFDGTNWTNYNVDNSGIAHEQVYSIAIDGFGNIWAATVLGLSKFDGNNWITYNVSNSGICGNYVTQIEIDNDNNIWILCPNSGGVTKFDGINWNHYYPVNNSGINIGPIGSLAIDQQNNIWLGAYLAQPGTYGGIYKFDGNNWTAYTRNDYSDIATIKAVTIDSLGNKWFVNSSNTIIKFDDVSWTTYRYPGTTSSIGYISKVYFDKYGNKWFGTKKGLCKLVDTTWTFYDTIYTDLPTNKIWSVTCDMHGNKWFGTVSKGYIKYNDTDWFHSGGSYSAPFFKTDWKNNVWFISNYGTASLFDGTNWANYKHDYNYDYFNALDVDKNGTIWFATQNDGIKKFDGNNWTIYNTSNGLVDDNVTSVAIDHQNDKWFGTSCCGVSKFDGTNWTTYNSFNSGLPNRGILAIAVDENDNKWFATYGGGIVKFNGTNWTTYNTFNSNLPDSNVVCITIDRNNNVWVGTQFKGAAKYDGLNWSVYNTNNSGLSSNGVEGIAIDELNNIWFATEGGISIFIGDDSTFTTYLQFDHSACDDSLITLNVQKNNGNPPYSYSWQAFGDSLSCNNCENPTTIITQNSTYVVSVTDSNNKTDSDTLIIYYCGFIDNVTDVNEVASKNSISIYPNPTNSNFTVTLPPGTKQITITNTLGQVVQTQTINKEATPVEISLAESGTYFIHVTTAGATVTKKVIVIR